MQKPFFSITFSIITWIIIVCFFSGFLLNNQELPIPEIAIDAEMIGQEIGNKKPPQLKNESAREEVDDKISDLKAKEENKSHHDHHLNEERNKEVAKAKILSQPLPEIPEDLRREAFSSKAIARFYILANGDVEKVELIKPCANPKLNYLLLKSLQQWQFSKQNQNSTRDIEVNFRVID